MKVQRIGKTSATQVTLENGTEVLVSYETPVAAYIPGEGWFRTNRRYSNTTSKQIGQWLGGVPQERDPEFFQGLLK